MFPLVFGAKWRFLEKYYNQDFIYESMEVRELVERLTHRVGYLWWVGEVWVVKAISLIFLYRSLLQKLHEKYSAFTAFTKRLKIGRILYFFCCNVRFDI